MIWIDTVFEQAGMQDPFSCTDFFLAIVCQKTRYVNMPGFSEEVKGYTYDREKAVQLLSEAGYQNGRGLSLKLVYHNDESQRELCEAIQAMFKDIGVDLKIEEMLGATHRSAQNEGKLTFWRANWGADYYDRRIITHYFTAKTTHQPDLILHAIQTRMLIHFMNWD